MQAEQVRFIKHKYRTVLKIKSPAKYLTSRLGTILRSKVCFCKATFPPKKHRETFCCPNVFPYYHG